LTSKGSEQRLWDERYSAGWLFGQEPNDYLASKERYFRPGMTALAVADGQGRNAVSLAQREMQVTLVDISPVALEQARELAEERRVALETVCADLTDWAAPEDAYDVIVEIFAHFPGAVRGAIRQSLAKALKPGGLFVFEGFHERQAGRPSGGPKDPDMLYTREKLLHEFPDFTFLELLEGTVVLDEGVRHQGEAWVVRALAQRL
jgi:SAM-dependent methyltransferase